MKNIHKYLTLLIACMLTTSMSATYYIAGNGTDDPNGKWCNNSNWGFQALNGENTITFTGVAAGKNYGFKIKDSNSWGTGSEYTTFDYENSDEPLYGGDGGDMGFTLTETADVTISVVDGKVRVHATKALAYRSNYYYLAGNGGSGHGDWCANKNWNSSGLALVNDEISFTALPAEWYECKVTNGTWDKTWGYSSVNAESSTFGYKDGGGNNIGFRLTAAADVTIKVVKGQVVVLIDPREFNVTGNGSEIAGGVWLSGHDWWKKDDDTKLDADNSITFTNLPPATYKFKVKDYIDAWSTNGDCTWGWNNFDSEHSITCVEDGDNNIKFELSALSDITISLVANKIRVTSSPAYVVAGNGTGGVWLNGISGWNSSAAVNRLDPTTYSISYSSVPAGSYEFKVVKGAWGEGNEWAAEDVDLETSSKGYQGSGANNIKFDLQEATDITITFNPETGKISLVNSHGYFLSNVYSVAGVSALTGSNWSNTATDTELTPKGDGTYELILRDKELAAGSYEYKIIGGHSWGAGCEYPTTNAKVSIAEAGTYTVVFTLNPAEGTQSNVAYKQHDITISQYSYSSFYSDRAYIVPDGLTATIYTAVNGEALTGETIAVIPANTGVILHGAANATYTLLQTTTTDSYDSNLLKGSTADEVINNDEVHYILGVNSGKCGLYWPNGTTEGKGSFTNAAGKAYLELAPAVAPVGARGFVLRATDTATAVEDVPADADDTYYDLLGRKVLTPQPGNVYICNGKKIVVF